MPEQFPHPSPEVAPIADDMPAPLSVDMPGLTGVRLTDGQSMSIGLTADEFASANNARVGVEQRLMGIVVADSDTQGNTQAPLALIAVKEASGLSENVAVARMQPAKTGQRAELMGIIAPGQSLALGRNQIRPDSKFTSRQHVEISLDQNGAVEVKDLNSSNGTDVLTPGEAQPEQVAPRGIRRLLKRDKGEADPELSIEGYLADKNPGWAVKSAVLKQGLDNREQDTRVESETETAEKLTSIIEAGVEAYKNGAFMDSINTMLQSKEISSIIGGGEYAFISELLTPKQLEAEVERMARHTRTTEIAGFFFRVDGKTIWGEAELPEDKFDPELVAELWREKSLLVLEEALQILQAMPEGSIFPDREPPDSILEEELFVAQYFDEHGIELSNDFLTRYSSRREWAMERFPERAQSIRAFAISRRRS